MDISTDVAPAEVKPADPDIDTGTGIVISASGFKPGPLEACSFGEITKLFGIGPHTAYQWRNRDILPMPDDTVSGRDLWHVRTMIQWGRQTGRTVYLHPDAANRYLSQAA